MKGWEYECANGEFKRWTKDLPDGGYVEVYYNTDISLSLVDPPVKWEYVIYSVPDNEDTIDTFPDDCTTLAEKLAYVEVLYKMGEL